MLCTLTQVKVNFLGIGALDTEHDNLLNLLIEGVSEQLAVAAGRVHEGRACLEKAARTVLFSPGAGEPGLWLPAWPIVSITEIKEAVYGAFDDADALVENTDYQVNTGLGRLIRIGFWLAGERCVRVTYPGGYTPPDVSEADGYEQGDGEVLLPHDIRMAAIKQTVFSFNRRKRLGLTSEGIQGGSFSSYARDELLPEVRQTMAKYRRMMG